MTETDKEPSKVTNTSGADFQIPKNEPPVVYIWGWFSSRHHPFQGVEDVPV